eukprot:TRINITY_DN870_c0_g2_i12.p1 TRINITY_DN870_c0_g2~~TRINITY_DN870_c0_g2_i12.p1  ORF type:complete len:172 (+),score=6.49 TRINITY_DN870_c0_g2_i12:466-981(+)
MTTNYKILIVNANLGHHPTQPSPSILSFSSLLQPFVPRSLQWPSRELGLAPELGKNQTFYVNKLTNGIVNNSSSSLSPTPVKPIQWLVISTSSAIIVRLKYSCTVRDSSVPCFPISGHLDPRHSQFPYLQDHFLVMQEEIFQKVNFPVVVNVDVLYFGITFDCRSGQTKFL